MGSPVFFVWKDSFALGIPGIDAEHRQFFEIMNRCARAAAEGATALQVDLLLRELAVYAEHHFRNEEAALDRVGYPGLAEQRAEHRQFREALARLAGRDDPGVLAALMLARDWLLQHVLGTDRRYVDWIEQDRPRRTLA